MEKIKINEIGRLRFLLIGKFLVSRDVRILDYVVVEEARHIYTFSVTMDNPCINEALWC